jgi:hypothetical protein
MIHERARSRPLGRNDSTERSTGDPAELLPDPTQRVPDIFQIIDSILYQQISFEGNSKSWHIVQAS